MALKRIASIMSTNFHQHKKKNGDDVEYMFNLRFCIKVYEKFELRLLCLYRVFLFKISNILSRYRMYFQMYRVANVFENTLEEKKICSSVFLDVTRAFDKVWHRGLKRSVKRIITDFEIFYHSSTLRVKREDEYFQLKKNICCST